MVLRSGIACVLAILPLALAAQAPSGGRVITGEEFADLLTSDFDARMQAQADANIAALARAGLLVVPNAQTSADLAWPLRQRAPFDQFAYHGISNFVDHDPRFPQKVQDYTCGQRTYDLDSGYNHAGTDYYLWPFPWLMMDQGQIEIVAAAPGVLVGRDDGNFDRQCFFDGTSQPNFVRILQDDGLSAIYLHMRDGSVTTVPIGTHVEAGDYLGLVGSSGQSSGPHLHFELRDANGVVIDPRHGACNAEPERWTVLQPYEDPHIDSLSTHSEEPEPAGCGFMNGAASDDNPHYKNVFAPGDALWVFVSYRDQRNGEVTAFTILQPDGSPFAQWQFDLASEGFATPFYSGTTWDWKYILPQSAPAGSWQVRAVFEGVTYTHGFVVENPAFIGNARDRRAHGAGDATRCRPSVTDSGSYNCAP